MKRMSRILVLVLRIEICSRGIVVISAQHQSGVFARFTARDCPYTLSFVLHLLELKKICRKRMGRLGYHDHVDPKH